MDKENIDKPIVSIVVLLRDFFHLANITMKSIVDQREKSYEIIVISISNQKRNLIMLKPYMDKIKTVEYSKETNLAVLMNKGLNLSQGKYIQFLFSGDILISKYILSYLKDLIIEKKYPHLISSAFLRRDEFLNPEAISFSFDYFKRGKIPMNIQSCWFSVESVQKLKKFNLRYKIQPGFDMICKIFLKKDKKVVFSNRVLTDYQFKKIPSKLILLKAFENLKIIYKNFGLFKTIYWWAIHDHFRMLKLFMLSLKRAFWNP
ncbi:MAG: hypothetical protein K1060chlam1_00071 [Candidatus Anoxychlamydiales bacterium]|nr:hypothetical protein [Candidatus Anoxychlamydiales bacterium]